MSTLTVHPRRSGEHLDQPAVLFGQLGSSPQERGTLSFFTATDGTNRFIPAGAGNTSAWMHTSYVCAVHPRRSGEHFSSTFLARSACGSSPQERGTHSAAWWSMARHRFTPAGAGNTPKYQIYMTWTAVHPRRSGEHLCSFPVNSAICGSSPQERGTPCKTQSTALFARFIPAGAGNTLALMCSIADATVHPRRSGEHPSL